ncbi:hypothetical protein Slin15195_G105510 [Septoria linicola]|uniref:Uncharacterized protein n=1 Tax=Septoria linicola TaxID=215465 RepID=A0A9Q9AWL5_9PEZI|nr:hypothetical protein Slin14017_G068520 [Septoria linicola]USW57232.1 hypothetical protein Slin15195_G105510 [Septoria linicola]
MSKAAAMTKKAAKPSRRGFALYTSIIGTATVTAILVVAFKTDSSVIYHDADPQGVGGTGSRLQPDDVYGGLGLRQYPQSLNDRGSVSITLASSGLSLALGSILSMLCIFVWRRSKAVLFSDWQRLGLWIVLIGNCILSLAVLIICIVHRAQSGRFDPKYRSPATEGSEYGPSWQYDGATFDLGSWACQVSAYSPYRDDDRMLSRQCVDENGALASLALMVLTNVGMFGVMWWDWRGARLLLRGYNDAFPDEYECDDY